MPPQMPIWQEFESFVADLFKRYQISVLVEPSPNQSYDLKVRNIAGTVAIVEIKFYQSLKVAPDLLRRSFDQIAGVMSRANVGRGIFVTNARVPAALRHENDQLTVWDYDTVSFLVGTHADLADRWGRLSQEGFIHRSEALPEPVSVGTIGFLDHPPLASKPKHISGREYDLRGAELCKQLKEIKPGKGNPQLILRMSAPKH